MNFASLLPGLALVAGMLFSVQSGINARLAIAVGGPLMATLISFTVGALALAIVTWATSEQAPLLPGWYAAPLPILFGGGLLGAGILATNVFLIPRIGVASVIGFSIAGQMLAALVIDRFGVFGVPIREMSTGRAIGAILVLVGALLVRLL